MNTRPQKWTIDKPVREDRSLRRLRQEVVHDAENRRGEEEGDGVVAVPPLDQRILDPGEDRVALHHRDGNLEAVHDVQNCDRDDRRDVEPKRDVQMLFSTLSERPEEIDREDDPDQGDRDVDRPLELCVFLARGDTRGEA